MSLNIARQLLFRRGTGYGVHHSRRFGITAQANPRRRVTDDLLGAPGVGAASERPQGIKVHYHAERLSIVETLIITFGVGTVTLGLGTLALKVMCYDVEANKEMRLHIEKVVNAAGEKTRLKMEIVRIATELSTKRQIDDAFNGISEVIRGGEKGK